MALSEGKSNWSSSENLSAFLGASAVKLSVKTVHHKGAE
jgi:hypothetical protein